jgi:hypothetical protein
MDSSLAHAERTARFLVLGSDKSARRESSGLLALLAPCWVRDLEISSAEEEAVSEPICSALLGALCPNISEYLARESFLEAQPTIVVSPMLSMWSCVSRKL